MLYLQYFSSGHFTCVIVLGKADSSYTYIRTIFFLYEEIKTGCVCSSVIEKGHVSIAFVFYNWKKGQCAINNLQLSCRFFVV